MRTQAFLAVMCSLCASSAAFGVDHNNLDPGRPVRIEDAYPISHGELVLELGGIFSSERHNPARAAGDFEILYGALPNLQLGLGSTVSAHPRDLDDGFRSGDLRLSALYNFNQETMTLPALAVKGTLNFPTGIDSTGVDGEIKAILTKSFDRVSLHFNAAYQMFSGTADQEKSGTYEFSLGASVPLGAPHSTRTTLVTDIFVKEGPLHGQSETVGAEIGIRYQLAPRTVLDVGIGTEFAGSERSPVFGTIGVSFSF